MYKRQIFKWVFKSAAAILIVTNTWNIVMGVFDMAQSVVAQAAGIIGSDASIDISSVMTDLEPRLMEMDLGPLFGLWFQSLFIGITMWALYICIFIVIYGRMIEIYLAVSYTHLDVYKRQPDSSSAGGSGSCHPTQARRVHAYYIGGIKQPEISRSCLLYTSRCV